MAPMGRPTMTTSNSDSRQATLEAKVSDLAEVVSGLVDKVKSFDSFAVRLEQVERAVYEGHRPDEVGAAKDRRGEGLVSHEGRFNEMDVELSSLKRQLVELMGVYDDLQDRFYEIDRSWQNNLIFYGIRPDQQGTGCPSGVGGGGGASGNLQQPVVTYESQECIEQKVKACIRNSLNIARDIPIQRAQRIYHGADVRGFKPVVVNFQKWTDKEEVFRKAKMMRNNNCGIHVEEDYSRAAKFRRKELEKLAKSIKQLSPEKKCYFKYDKLVIDDQVFIYNDVEKRIERLPVQVSGGCSSNSAMSHSTVTLGTGPSAESLLSSEEPQHHRLQRRHQSQQQQQQQQPLGGVTGSRYTASGGALPGPPRFAGTGVSSRRRTLSVESLINKIPNHISPAYNPPDTARLSTTSMTPGSSPRKTAPNRLSGPNQNGDTSDDGHEPDSDEANPTTTDE